jgi:hypothetical protein
VTLLVVTFGIEDQAGYNHLATFFTFRKDQQRASWARMENHAQRSVFSATASKSAGWLVGWRMTYSIIETMKGRRYL